MIDDELGGSVGGMDVGCRHDQHEPQHTDGQANAQRADAPDPLGPSFSSVVADPVLAVTAQGSRHSLGQVVVDFLGGELDLQADRAP